MPSPFPGVDPYLEDSEIWPGFHARLANEIADQLNTILDPKYYADVEVRTIFEEVNIVAAQAIYPDVGIIDQAGPFVPSSKSTAQTQEIPTTVAPVRRVAMVMAQDKLRTVEVFVTETKDLITAIEILSPYNKRSPKGLGEYQEKRKTILKSRVHLIELDLLRGGHRPGTEVAEPPLETDYILLLNRVRYDERRISEIWPVALNEPLPKIPVPLTLPDPDVLLDVGAAIQAIYHRARYESRIDYRKPIPPPALRSEMAQWAEHLIHNTLTKKDKHDI